ncbi:MAG: patatin [Synergistaceae bacterium]|nr:patatin [Synergistaceae bacterium]
MSNCFKRIVYMIFCIILFVSPAFAAGVSSGASIVNITPRSHSIASSDTVIVPSIGVIEKDSTVASEDKASILSHNRQWGFRHKEGIVLVLSGGGTKGLAHVGVFEVLEKANIPIAAIVGTSMGGIMGGLYASGYTSEEMKAILNKTNLVEIISDRSIAGAEDVGYNMAPSNKNFLPLLQKNDKKSKACSAKRGALKAKNLYTFLSDLTSRVSVTNFDDLPIPFAAIATNLQNGETVLLRDGNLASSLRATMSIPGVFEPWEMDGLLLVDGGMKANLPVIEAKKMFPGHPIVAINLSPEDITCSLKSTRSVLGILAQSLEILMVGQVRENAAEADLVIAPKVDDFGVLDSGGYAEIIERGVKAATPYVEDIRKLVEENNKLYDAEVHAARTKKEILTVMEVRFEGIPKNISESLHSKYQSWIGQPLDMKKMADAIKELSSREDFRLVEGRTKRIGRNTVEVVISMERPPKYELGLNGYVGNINRDSWLAIAGQIRDILMDGDVGSLEYRIGNRWGLLGRYFTTPTFTDSQFGLVVSARQEGVELRNGDKHDFERYSARLAWYKSFGQKARLGIGYAVSKVTEGDTLTGPYLTLNINTLDDPILPSKGWSITSDVWAPLDEVVLTHNVFQYHLPTFGKWKLVLSGGLKTGDEDNIAYAAILGNREELYSLSKYPLVGDQAYWLHLGAARTMIRSWWGGVNIELFGRYGQVMKEWKNSDSWWETGLAFTVPTNNFAGKLVVVYDQGGEFTFGYSFGIPRWWNGPLP